MPSLKPTPFVRLNVASTIDGKLAPSTRRFIPFTSRRDQNLLLQLRTEADAVMSGARTVDLGPVDLGPGPARYRRMRLQNGLAEYNLRVVVSGSASLNPRAEIFRHLFSPIIVLVSERAPKDKIAALRRAGGEVKAFGRTGVDFTLALEWLREQWGVRRLLCEGGGEVNAGLFREGLVDEVYLTVAPLVFGGRKAPTMADGDGIPDERFATRLRLHSCKRSGNELFLVYRVLKRAARLRVKPEKRSETP